MLERNAFFKGLLGASLLVGVGATGSTAASAADCVDTDGDGWGWDGNETCDPNSGSGGETDPSNEDTPQPASENRANNQSAENESEADAKNENAENDSDDRASDRPRNVVSSEQDESTNQSSNVDSPEQQDAPQRGECTDSDGDGWGWDGIDTCTVASKAAPVVPQSTPAQAKAEVEQAPSQSEPEPSAPDAPDVANPKSVASEPSAPARLAPEPTEPASVVVEQSVEVDTVVPQLVVQSSSGPEQLVVETENKRVVAECVDVDGDGWGWDGQASCQIVGECTDSDGDGWGWDGHATCGVQDTPNSGYEEVGGIDPIDAGPGGTITAWDEFSYLPPSITNGPTNSTPTAASEWAPECESATSDWRLYIDPAKGPCEYTPNGDGAGVTVYVLDGEIDKSHQALQGVKFAPTVDLVGSAKSVAAPSEGDSSFKVTSEAPGSSCGPGHATQVVSTLASQDVGVASGVTVAPVEITFCGDGATSEAGYLSDLTDGLQHVLDNHDGGQSIVNLSVAVSNDKISTTDRNKLAGLVSDLSNDGVLVVSAAGNAGDGACNYTPANVAGGNLTVGALVAPGETHRSYNKGKCVDIYAPSEVRGANDQTGGYMHSTGTSMATPVVAGIAAIYWAQNPHLTAAQVMADVKANAARFDEAGTDCGNACLAAKIVGKTPTPTTRRTLV